MAFPALRSSPESKDPSLDAGNQVRAQGLFWGASRPSETHPYPIRPTSFAPSLVLSPGAEDFQAPLLCDVYSPGRCRLAAHRHLLSLIGL